MDTKVWSSGWNIPGYLPEVEPMNFPTFKEAAAALEEALSQAAADFETDSPAEADLYHEAMTQLDAAPRDRDVTLRVGNYVWWVQHITLPEEHEA